MTTATNKKEENDHSTRNTTFDYRTIQFIIRTFTKTIIRVSIKSVLFPIQFCLSIATNSFLHYNSSHTWLLNNFPCADKGLFSPPSLASLLTFATIALLFTVTFFIITTRWMDLVSNLILKTLWIILYFINVTIPAYGLLNFPNSNISKSSNLSIIFLWGALIVVNCWPILMLSIGYNNNIDNEATSSVENGQ
ncbi:MAG: hypothetical protein GY737_17405 [Desulfobacteraceae bacterium]|nr:hypothetical protein [Desulfobacteraceae bacterium]